MLLLLLSLAALALGPIVYALAARRPAGLAALDSFIFVVLSGLVLLHLVPHALGVGRGAALVAALIGLVGPTVAERLLRRAAAGVHLLALTAAMVGLAGHAFLDGLALTTAGGALSIAVILHRVPDGVAIWWLLRAPYGRGVAASTLGLMGLATVAGFFVGDAILINTNQAWLASIQAFVAASLVHVVLHRPHVGAGERARGVPELAGGVLGAGLLAAILLHRHEAHGATLLTAVGLGLFLGACLVRYGRWRWTEKLVGHHEHASGGAQPGEPHDSHEHDPHA